jgi:succinate dehydrogenase / fumarate reductase flavoprotein subunit
MTALQEMMQDLAGIVRTESELLQAKESLIQFRQRARKVRVEGNREYNNAWHTALDLQHMIIVSEAITLAAIYRKESRGAHFRIDYPDPDPVNGKMNQVIRKDSDGRMRVESIPLKPVRPDLQQLIDEMK